MFNSKYIDTGGVRTYNSSETSQHPFDTKLAILSIKNFLHAWPLFWLLCICVCLHVCTIIMVRVQGSSPYFHAPLVMESTRSKLDYWLLGFLLLGEVVGYRDEENFLAENEDI